MPILAKFEDFRERGYQIRKFSVTICMLHTPSSYTIHATGCERVSEDFFALTEDSPLQVARSIQFSHLHRSHGKLSASEPSVLALLLGKKKSTPRVSSFQVVGPFSEQPPALLAERQSPMSAVLAVTAANDAFYLCLVTLA
jgi:hypothetical protein